MDPVPRMNTDPAVRKTSVAWGPFAHALARALEQLDEDQFLVISDKGSSRFVQFAAQGSFGLRAEVVSNAYLQPTEWFDAIDIARLGAMGWRAPTGAPDTATPELDPDGSPNFHIDCPTPVAFAEIAQTAVRALVQVLGVHHPSWLQYDAFDGAGDALDLPPLGLQRRPPKEPTREALAPRQLLLATVREATGLDGLELDEDGDVPVRYGSVAAFVRHVAEPPSVRYQGLLLCEVEPDARLQDRLNSLNDAGGPVRFYLHDDAVLAYAEIPASPFVAEHVRQTLHAFFERCDGIGPELRRQFGGELLPGCDATPLSLH